jgi:hypothetical protein
MSCNAFFEIRGNSHISLIRIGNTPDEVDVFQGLALTSQPSFAQSFGGQTSPSPQALFLRIGHLFQFRMACQT